MNCYNGEKYLREAIDSVLAQTFKNWELIFWDNRSTDGSAEIFHSYEDSRLRYFLAPKHTNLGSGRAQAWRHLNAEFVGIIDTDDVWLPRKIEEQLKCFHPLDVGICITNVELFREKRKRVLYNEDPPEGWVTNNLLKNYYVVLTSVVLRRSSIQSLDYALDPEFSHIADFDLITRLSTSVKLAYVPTVLTRVRVHADSESARHREKFSAERKSWIAKNRNSPIFSNYSCSLKQMIKDARISSALDCLQVGDNKKVRKEVESLGLGYPKALVVYVCSFLPMSRYLLKLGRLLQPIPWWERY